ncbi:putative Amphoterin-induced protein 2 [Operophtera brumata]|uniref:Hemolin n=1 Tax=Operophtera brumata TaxID=104452 RepID=A0A0L7KVM3_OPEBR|nr:putative Amphoterin-induced protein 2 [Operophtera brumata]
MRVRGHLDVRLIALCTTCLLLPAIACPAQCICKWKNGKRYVECSEKELKAIPNSLDSETQVLDFTGNDLRELQKETFHHLGLLDLQKIYLQRCRLQKIDNHAFKGLANLVELDLSNNHLAAIPSSNFVFFPSLMRLSLNNNPITSIKTHCFQHLSYLNTLELTDCKIESVEQEAFAGLNHLEWLRLNGNRLSTVRGENLFPDTLRGIDLQNNNWNCDCHLRDLHSWLLNFNMPHAVEPICSLPERLKRRTITSVTNGEFACLPNITPSTVFLETNVGSNVTLECMVKAIPEAQITWLYQGQVIHNYSSMSPEQAHDVYFLENGVTDKKSELYIYSIAVEDNGTYACVAENPAGKSRANYTIRILVKEEPVVIVVTFPQRHLVVIVTVIFLIIVLLIAIIAVVLLKFKTDTSRSRKKKESGKDVALCNQILPSSRSNGNIPKNNGSLIVNAHSHHALHYTVQTGREYDSNDMYQSNNLKGFVDRNPDLISDAETVANNTQNENAVLSVYNQTANSERFEEETAFTTATMQRQVTWQDQQPHNMPGNPVPSNNMYQHSADVHLNPGCFLDSEGYPYDYGLPKHPCRPPIMSNYSVVGPFYQTLPHNRPKGQKLVCKFAKDTEFNTPPPTCPNFEMFGTTNVRRTLEGYPVPRNRPIAFVGNGTVYYNEEFVPSPPEGYKSESVQCCAPTEACSSWVSPKGTCAVMVPVVAEGTRCYQVETRCVDTQTGDARLPGEGSEAVLKPLPQVSNAKCAADVCSESPDEGYVGDANDI